MARRIVTTAPREVVCIQDTISKKMEKKAWAINKEDIPVAVKTYLQRNSVPAYRRKSGNNILQKEFNITKKSASLFIETIENYLINFKPNLPVINTSEFQEAC